MTTSPNVRYTDVETNADSPKEYQYQTGFIPKPVLLATVETKDTPKPTQKPRSISGRVLSIEWGHTGQQCVTFVKSKGYNINGNARQWLENAPKYGYETGIEPRVGSVVVTSESSAGTNTGHVAYIEDVRDGYIYVVESNYVRLTVSHGRIPIGSPLIRGYIYQK